MRHIGKLALVLGGLSVSGAAMPAFAGGCGYGSNPAACSGGVSVNTGYGPSFGPTTIHIEEPMGHLSTVNYTRSPNVSITRIHGMGPTAALTDAPSGFTGGCFPTSTQYCRSDAGTPINVQMGAGFNPQAFAPQIAQPVMQAPVLQAPVMRAPLMQAPIIQAPLPAPRIVAIGKGYNPSKFMPRVYGDNTITPGIVHAPTSYIDRNPASAAQALQRASSYSVNLPTTYAGSSNYSVNLPTTYAGSSNYSVNLPTTYSGTTASGYGSAGTVSDSGSVTGPVDASGGYWEKVSGLTRFGDTIATQVICRRQAPQVQVQAPVQQNLRRVVRPVIGVPTPVPTPVPYTVDVPVCGPVGNFGPGFRPGFAPRGPVAPQFGPYAGPQFGYGPKPRPVPVPQPLTNGRWTY